MKLIVDRQVRIAAPDSRPGDVFACETAGEGRYILTRLDHSGASKRLSKEEVLKAINGWNTKMNISWEQLRQLTREV